MREREREKEKRSSYPRWILGNGPNIHLRHLMSVIEKRLPEEKLKNLSKSRPFSRGRKLRCRSRRERETSFEFKLRKFLDISNTYLHNLLNFTYLGRKEDLHICTTKPLEERHSRWISEIFIGNDSISHSPRSAASR